MNWRFAIASPLLALWFVWYAIATVGHRSAHR